MEGKKKKEIIMEGKLKEEIAPKEMGQLQPGSATSPRRLK